MTDTPALLDVKNLSVGFKTQTGSMTAVYNACFTLHPGETLGIVGESGSGKSVTALSILQLLPYPTAFHDRGEILFDGKNMLKATPEDMRAVRGNDIAMIFQEPMTSLNPLHSIEKQIGEVLELHQGLRGGRLREEVLRLLERVGIPDAVNRLGALPHELSGGQRQRVMIAMALANKPKLLIADEPTTALDVTVQKQILDLLKELQADTGMALLLITHDLGVVKYMADKVCVMKDGEIVEQNGCAALFSDPQHAYTKDLINAEPDGLAAPLADDRYPLLETGQLRVHFPIKKGFFGTAKSFVKAVDDISLDIAPGETLGIVGESGSGKTTLGRALLRLQKAQGDISFAGERISLLNTAAMRPLRRKMQIVFQDPYGALSPRMSVGEIISEGLQLHHPHMSAMERDIAVSEVLSDVGLRPDMADRYPHEFSGGQRQRIAIARAVILNPELLVLDEPTSALDRSVQAQIVELLRRLQAARNMAYLFISHDLKVVRALAHRVIVMKDGAIIEQGPCADIFSNPQTDYTRKLIQAAFELVKS
ncbi:MAG: ABC transporter ATP-binding protein [Parvibaculales bacterium]